MHHFPLSYTCQICWSWIGTQYTVSLDCMVFAKKRFLFPSHASVAHPSANKYYSFLSSFHTDALKASKTFSYLKAFFHLAEWWQGFPCCFPLSHQETSTGMCLLHHCSQLWKKEKTNVSGCYQVIQTIISL